MSTARLKMMRAGYRSKSAVRTFHARSSPWASACCWSA